MCIRDRYNTAQRAKCDSLNYCTSMYNASNNGINNFGLIDNKAHDVLIDTTPVNWFDE